MIYSTLKEVYNVDTFEKKKKKKCIDDYSDNGDEVISKDSKDKKNKDLYLQATPTQCATPPSRKHSMTYVKPFLDDELEHYFNFNVPKPSAVVSTPGPVVNSAVNNEDAIHVSPVNSNPVNNIAIPAPAVTPVSKPIISSVQTTQSKQDAYYKNLINIGLFVFIGILIIFLCDQITEIAINIGMKKTVAILEPYLVRLEKLQEN